MLITLLSCYQGNRTKVKGEVSRFFRCVTKCLLILKTIEFIWKNKLSEKRILGPRNEGENHCQRKGSRGIFLAHLPFNGASGLSEKVNMEANAVVSRSEDEIEELLYFLSSSS